MTDEQDFNHVTDEPVEPPKFDAPVPRVEANQNGNSIAPGSFVETPQEEEEAPMDLYSMFETEESLEKKGVTIEYGEAGSFQVARAGGANSKYAKSAESVMRPFRRLIEQELLPDDKAKTLLYTIFAESIVLAWEGVRAKPAKKGERGELIPFTIENCVQLFMNLPELFADIQSFASAGKNFKADDVEGDAKN